VVGSRGKTGETEGGGGGVSSKKSEKKEEKEGRSIGSLQKNAEG